MNGDGRPGGEYGSERAWLCRLLRLIDGSRFQKLSEVENVLVIG